MIDWEKEFNEEFPSHYEWCSGLAKHIFMFRNYFDVKDLKSFIQKKLEEQEKKFLDDPELMNQASIKVALMAQEKKHNEKLVFETSRLIHDKTDMEKRLSKKIDEWQDDYIEMKKRLRLKDIDIEPICEKVHQAYCQYCLDIKRKQYWTCGDYSKLDEETKEADRYTVRAVLKEILLLQGDKE